MVQTEYDVFPTHGEVYADGSSLRSGDQDRHIARVVEAIKSGHIPFPLKRYFIRPSQVDGWFAHLRSLPLALSTARYTVHGYYAPSMPEGVLVPHGRDAVTVPERLSYFGEPGSPGAPGQDNHLLDHPRDCGHTACLRVAACVDMACGQQLCMPTPALWLARVRLPQATCPSPLTRTTTCTPHSQTSSRRTLA